jgi:hypothetical protein
MDGGFTVVRHRFVVYPLNHTILLVDLTEIGIPDEIYPQEGKLQMVPPFVSEVGNQRRPTS